MEKVFQQFGKGEVIIPEGVKGDRAYRIVSGDVLICKKNGQGRLIPIAKLGPDELVGEMYMFEQSGLRSATVIAANDVKVEVFFGERIQEELRQAPPEIRRMLASFNSRLNNTTGSVARLFKDKVIVELPDGTMKVVDNR